MDLNTLIERQYALQCTDQSVSSSSTRYVLNIGLEKVGVLFDFNPEIVDYIFKLIKEDLRKKKQEKDQEVIAYPKSGQAWSIIDTNRLVVFWCTKVDSKQIEKSLGRPWSEIILKAFETLGKETALFARDQLRKRVGQKEESPLNREIEEFAKLLGKLYSMI